MDDLIHQLSTILRGVWQRRWIGIGVAWLVGVIGAVVVLLTPDRFEASARIAVDTQSLLRPLMQGMTVEPNIEQQLAMLSRTLISRPNVEKLIHMAGLDDKSRKEKDALVSDVMRRLEIRTAGRDNLYILSFRDTDPARAKRVVEGFAAIFVDANKGQDAKDSAEAKKFIADQIQEYEKKLQQAENRLKEFRLGHLGLSEGGMDHAGQMSDVSTRLNEARLALHEAENSRDALKRQISGEDPSLSLATGAVSEIDARIDTLKRNLDNLLQRYTEQHPDVMGTRRIIAELEEQRRKEAAARARGGPAKPEVTSSANPVYQRLRVSLAESEANVASLRARVAEYERRSQQLKDSARLVPEVEAQLAQLNRDYETIKKQYEQLVARRESAHISDELRAVSGSVEFRVIDPPRVPSTPVAPNRLVLMPLTLLASLGVGLLASFGAFRLWPTFVDRASLKDVTGLPVLGSVSFQQTAESRRKSRLALIRFVSALGTLIIAFAAATAMLFALSLRVAA